MGMFSECYQCGSDFVCPQCSGLEEEIDQLKATIVRLKRGDFTPDELQNLCHNLDETDKEAFCKGCTEYQKKLFGHLNDKSK